MGIDLLNLNSWATILCLISVALGFLMHLPFFWIYRRTISSLSSVFIGASTGFIIVTSTPVMAILVFIIQTYRLFSHLRIVQDRVDERILKTRTLRSEILLSGSLLALLALHEYGDLSVVASEIILLVAVVQLLCAVIFYRHAHHMFVASAIRTPKKFTPDVDLPTLTVAIPARNETTELADCLQSVLASNYPKLEVLVVDDCSQHKTSDIIKKFAHRGVRFVKGAPPPASWVAKTHAYDQLLDNASGHYVLFCGSDVRFEPNSLRLLIEITLKGHTNMVTVLPQRSNGFGRHFLLQPMRYWRELVIPRLWDKTPPALSTCWLAKREMLVKHGGFEGLRRAIRPERYIARGVEKEGHYKFVSASAGLGISSVKTLPAQWNTAVRTRYPELHNRPEAVCFVTLWQILLLIGPIALIALAIAQTNALLAATAALSLLYLLCAHFLVHRMATGKSSFKPLVMFPISVVLELVVLNYSMWAYEFSKVVWKGRNICLPVLKTTTSLPKLD